MIFLLFRNGDFINGPRLPEPLYDHCLVKVNDTHFFLAGGVNEMGWNNPRVWMYNFQHNKWSEMPKMIIPRYYAV